MKIPATLLAAALLFARPLCAAPQKMATPAGEAPWLMDTIGVGKNADRPDGAASKSKIINTIHALGAD